MEAFGREKRPMTLRDVAPATDLPEPSVRGVLYTLTCHGLAACIRVLDFTSDGSLNRWWIRRFPKGTGNGTSDQSGRLA